jgi:hypothetical protein
MQQWQHLFVEVDALTEPKNPERPELMKRMRRYGEQGWELVTLVKEGASLWAAFKRPAPEPASTPKQAPSTPRIGGR